MRLSSRWSVAGLTLAGMVLSVPQAATDPPLPLVTGGPVLTRPYVAVGETAFAVIPAYLDDDAHLDLVVANRGRYNYSTETYSGGSLSLVHGRGDGTMDPPVAMPFAGSPTAVAVADLNSDGRTDLVVTFGSSVNTYLADGTGGYGSARQNWMPVTVSGVAAGEFNHDGTADLAVTLGGLDEVAILLGGGDGLFTVGVRMPAGNNPERAVVGDLDEDGHTDLVVAGRGVACNYGEPCTEEPGDLTWLRGVGDGSFEAPASLVSGPRFTLVALGDFTGDGHPDIAAAGGGHPDLPGGLLIVPGGSPAGPGVPLPPIVSAGGMPNRMSVVDANGDPFADLTLRVFVNTNLGAEISLSTLLMRGDGTFEEVLHPISENDVLAMASLDLSGDGKPEVALTHSWSIPGTLEILTGAGSGRFVTETCFASGGDLRDLAVVHLDDDGRADLVAYDRAPLGSDPGDPGPVIRTFLADGRGGFREGPSVAVPGVPFRELLTSLMAVDDFDANGLPDLAVLHPYPGQVFVFLSRGGGAFELAATLRLSGGGYTIATGRLDADDRADLAVLQPCFDVHCGNGRVAVYRGAGNGGFEGPGYSAVGRAYSPLSMVAGDFDGNGRHELLVSNTFGTAHYTVGDDLRLSGGATVVGAGVGGVAHDMDLDGWLDLVVTRGILPGRGDGTFDPLRPLALGTYAAGVAAADMNGDGWPDAIGWQWPHGPGVAVALSDGQGGFGPPTTHYRSAWLGGLGTDDADRDGRVDTIFGEGVLSGKRLCIAPNVSGDPDTDGDGVPDAVDPCVDSDEDGFADRPAGVSSCPYDNCPSVPNPGQNDADADGRGDACDACPLDAGNDPDSDGACTGDDVCPGLHDPAQADQDGDGTGDRCDNCPAVASADQADWDGDGAGDACQPRLAFTGIIEDGGEALEVLAAASDPQGDPLTATIRIIGPPSGFTVPNIVLHEADLCEPIYGLPVGGAWGEGIVYVAWGGQHSLADLDGATGCADGQIDYLMALGPCEAPTGSFNNGMALLLDGLDLPATFCIARYPSIDGFLTLTILSADEEEIRLSYSTEPTVMSAVVPGGLPGSLPLSGVQPGVAYELQLSVSDGQTPAARAARRFVSHGESVMVFDPDADDDGASDDLDNCIDPEADGFGSPGGPSTTCDLDNCSAITNPNQEDADGDGAGDACDACTDPDGDGFGTPGSASTTCPVDNCPATSNPTQSDLDHDGVGDWCDECTDPDGDGFGNAGSTRTCPLDNCPTASNPDQADADGDSKGDACDTCTDTDRDGRGDPGYPANTCGYDNCPSVPNANQADADADTMGDACDTCTDPDRDGFGNPGLPATTCPLDNCPATHNTAQDDSDGDARGDLCDSCPRDALDDGDHDGLCADVDNCPALANASQADADADGIGDLCDTCTDLDQDGWGNPGYPLNTCPPDNCPGGANPAQEDRDSDQVGDVCDACVDDPVNDTEWDGRCGAVDNCPRRANALQRDRDGDGIGDACDAALPGPLFPGQIHRVGTYLRSLVVADMNADGLLDLVMADVVDAPTQPMGLVVLLAASEGGFHPPRTAYGGQWAGRVVVGDFNEDGRMDAAVGSSSANLNVLSGTGDGSFGPPAEIPTYYQMVIDLDAADIDRNGHLDIVVVSESSGSTAVQIFWGDGLGGFVPTVLRTGSGLQATRQAAVADFDRDGRLDLALVRSQAVSIGFGRGNGAFDFTPEYQAGYHPLDARVGDLDHDGAPDLVMHSGGNDGITRLLSRPGRTFERHTMPYVAGDWVRVADADGDGHQDLLTAGPKLFPGRGDGGFDPARDLTLIVREMEVADFNGDERPDLAFIQADSVGIVYGGPDGRFAAPLAVSSQYPLFEGVAVADLDRDGDQDVVVNQSGDGPMVFLGRGDGTFAGPTQPLPDRYTTDVATGDLNEDGIPDLVFPLLRDDRVAVSLGLGDGRFGAPALLPAGDGPGPTLVADLDGDGHLDIAVGNGTEYPDTAADNVSVFLGRGDGTFASQVVHWVGVTPSDLAAADLNHDGRPDLVVANRDSDDISVLLGSGGGAFTPFVRLPTGDGPASVAIGDLDADAHPDLVIANAGYPYGGGSAPDSVSRFAGVGNGQFVSLAPLATGPKPRSVLFADANADGIPDLVVASRGDSVDDTSLSVFPRLPAGGLAPEQRFGIGWSPISMAAGDFDADNRIDLAITSSSRNWFMVPGTGPYPADSDGDGLLDPADPCTDSDGDGFGDPGFRGNTCPLDNCPAAPNPGQADADADGLGDACDACAADAMNDADGDGVCGDVDRCPGIPDPGQADGDGDARGDACDNCPGAVNPGQADRDLDAAGDACDPCTDSDNDGAGDPDVALNSCPPDNCPYVPNPSQADTDQDGPGDMCDPCTDSDADGFGDPDIAWDTCEPDNCPVAANPGQEDANADGSGDACQPEIRIDRVIPDGMGRLKAHGRARDPQSEPLNGVIRVASSLALPVILPEVFVTYNCALGYSPDGVPGEGITYSFAALGEPYLFDLDSALGCVDAIPDYLVAAGTCAAPSGTFEPYLGLGGQAPPFAVCVRRVNEISGGLDFVVDSVDQDALTLRPGVQTYVLEIPFTGGLPEFVDLPVLTMGGDYTLVVEVTDGNTRPVAAQAAFLWSGEPVLLLAFNDPPAAVLAVPDTVECSGPAGGVVVLDGSGSTDPDSTPGSHDDIILFEWYENHGTPGETLLGTGETLTVTLGVGNHALTLKVTDREGEAATAAAQVRITDTTPPVIDCPGALPAAECSGAGGAFVAVTATAHDLCGGAVELTNDQTANGGDASGPFPLGITAVGFAATDARGNRATCAATVSVADTLAPEISALAGPQVLWPPNHEMVAAHVTWQVRDRCDEAGVRVELASVASSEPDDAPGPGDGETAADIQGADIGTPDADLLLRAERDGKGAGRVYEVRYRAIDRGGNEAFGHAVVTVPHDQGNGPEPLLMRLEPAVPGAAAAAVRITWPAIAGALGYDVIRGDLAAVRREDGVTNLGPVTVLARTTTSTGILEPDALPPPQPGQAFFYLVQPRTERGAVGWGSEPAPWPRVPAACDGGCPGAPAPPAPAGTSGTTVRR